MDWPTIITIVLGSSVLGAIINSAIIGYSKTRERRRYNSFVALTLAHAFEKYAHTCLDLVIDDDVYKNSGGGAGDPIDMPPESFDLPKEDFRHFDIKLLDDIFEFPQRVSFAMDEVSFTAREVDADSARSTSYKRTIELGNRALSLADRLRDNYSLPHRILKLGRLDLREELKKKIQ